MEIKQQDKTNANQEEKKKTQTNKQTAKTN